MYYEPYRKKQKPRRRRRGCFSRLIRLCFFAVILWIVLTLGSNLLLEFNIGGNRSLNANGDLPRGWTNILLLGSDSGEESGGRTDTIIIASISSGGTIKLTSVMRDVYLPMGEHGSHKLNAAYTYGGADLTMRTINESFGMNITKYAIVDFASFPQIIDAVGGIPMDISHAEMEEINKNFRSARRKTGVRPTENEYLSAYGENTLLSGEQALGYARIRSLDSDYARAQRQRKVLDALMRKIRSTRDPIKLARLAGAILGNIRTNINPAEMTALGMRALTNDAKIEQYRIPAEGTYDSGTRDGVWRIDANLSKNRELLRAFIYD